MENDVVKKEPIKLAEIVKEDGMMNIHVSKSTQIYELYGFLKVYTKKLGEMLYDSMESDENQELY